MPVIEKQRALLLMGFVDGEMALAIIGTSPTGWIPHPVHLSLTGRILDPHIKQKRPATLRARRFV